MPIVEPELEPVDSDDELRDFWRAFDVHRLQLRMQLIEALGPRPHGLVVLGLMLPDPVTGAGARYADLQRAAWLDRDWRRLNEHVGEQLAEVVHKGLDVSGWLELLQPMRGVLSGRILDGYVGDPVRARSALQGLARVLDHLTARFSEVIDQQQSPPAQTEAEQAEREASAQDTIRLVFDAAPVAMLAVTPDGTIFAGNRHAESMLGYVRGELDGLSLEVLVPEVLRERHKRLRGRFNAMPSARPMAPDKQLKAIRKDGSEIRVEVGLTPYDGAGGSLVLASLFEVTVDHQTSARLHRAMAELKRSNEELEQFAFVVSHDLQEPLRMVSSYSELLRRQYHGKLDDNADLYIEYAVDGAQRLSRVVQELLMYSRVGNNAGSFVPTDTAQLVEAVRGDLALALEERGAELVVEGRLPTVVADSSQLRLVFQNLIGNGIKFAREGVPPRVVVSAERSGEQWQFAVKDNGLGIEPQFVDRIFGLFQRLHSREEYDGSGIGLTITRRVVERHGGRISVESKLGEGSTFCFMLPLWPVTL